MFPNLASVKMYKPPSQIPSEDGNTTADSTSQVFISPPQQKSVADSENPETQQMIEERNNTPSSSKFDDICCTDDSGLKTKSGILLGQPGIISENDQEHLESKSDDGGMTLNQMIDAKCDDKIERNSANSSRRGSFSITTASQYQDEAHANRDESQQQSEVDACSVAMSMYSLQTS